MEFKTADFAPTNGNRISNFSFDEIGDDHFYTGLETPMRGCFLFEEFRIPVGIKFMSATEMRSIGDVTPLG